MDTSRLKSVLEILTLLTLFFYSLGLLVENTYLIKLSISEFSPLKSQFIFVGALAFFPIVFSFAYPTWWILDTFHFDPNKPTLRWNHWSNLIRVPYLLLGLIVPFFAYYGFIRSNEDLNTFSALEKTVTFYLVSFVMGISFYIIWKRMNPYVSDDEPAVWKELMSEISKGGKKHLPKILRYVGAIYFLFFVSKTYLEIFVNYIYPKIPVQYGGGAPINADVILTRNQIDDFGSTGLIGVKNTSVLSDVKIMYEGADFFVVETSDGSIFHISRNSVLGLKVIK